MSDDISCPRCRTTKYRNPNLKLMVNVCGHALCESCVELLFVRGSGNCPVCNVPLRRANFRMQFFEDASVDKEIDVRRRILKDYNKKESDFGTLREYNDYLEEVETIIFNLVNGIDVESTTKRVEAYKKDNKELISKNKFKKSKDELLIEDLIAKESSHKTLNVNDDLKRLAQEKIERQKEQQSLIDELMFSDASAADILQSHNEVQKLKEKLLKEEQAKAEAKAAQTQQITSQFGHHTTFMPIPRKVDVLYQYQAPRYDYLGPEPPTVEDVLHKGYLRNMRRVTASEKAGGYEAFIGCVRALQCAVEGLHLGSEPVVSPTPSDPASSEGSSMDIE